MASRESPDDFPDLTDAELDALAEISPEDTERAKQMWREEASPAFRDLLDAEPTDDDTEGGNG